MISVLESAGLSADIVVGSSIGAMFGAAYAAGWSSERICRIVSDAPRWAVADFYANRLRLDHSTYIGSRFRDLGDSTRIEDLPRSFACIALNCATGQVVAIRRGLLLQAVQASLSLPLVAEPVRIGPAQYRDAGSKAGIPTGIVRAMGADRTLRIELSPLAGLRRWRPLRPGTYPSRSPVSMTCSPPQTFEQEWAVGSQFSDREADVVIQPIFFGVVANSPFGARFCMQRGARAAEKHLAEIQGML